MTVGRWKTLQLVMAAAMVLLLACPGVSTYVGPIAATMPNLVTRRFVFTKPASLTIVATLLVSVQNMSEQVSVYVQRSNASAANITFSVASATCSDWGENPVNRQVCTSGVSCTDFPMTTAASGPFLSNALAAPLRWTALIMTGANGCSSSYYGFTVGLGVPVVAAATYAYALLSVQSTVNVTEAINVTDGTTIEALDTRFVVLTSVNSPLQTHMHLWQVAAALETSRPTIAWMDGVTSAACFIRDVSSFRAHYFSAGSSSFGALYDFRCQQANSVEAMQYICLQDDACLGYFSVVNTTTSLEVPACLLYAGKTTNVSYGNENRILYVKASLPERSCSFLMNASGTGTVFVSQTGLTQGTVSVYDRSTLLATCGLGHGFQGTTVVGQSGQCSDYFACYTGRFYLDSVIRVVVGSAIQANGCQEDAAILFSLTSQDAVPVLRNSTDYVVPDSLNSTDVARDFQHKVKLETSTASLLPLFVLNSRRVILNVNQTGFLCPATSACSNLTSMVDVVQVGGEILQSCGGSQTFLSTDGQSSMCQTQYYCGTPSSLVNNADQNFTGWLFVTLNDLSTLVSASTSCGYFAGDMSVSAYFSAADGAAGIHDGELSGFVLRSQTTSTSNTRYRVLALSNISTISTSADAAATIGSTLGSSNLVRIEALDDIFTQEQRGVFLVLDDSKIDTAAMANGSSLGVVMDFFSDALPGLASLPVPRGSNYVTVKISQTHFTEDGAAVDVVFKSGSRTLRSVECGSTAGSFQGLDPLRYKCDTFLVCFAGFLYARDTDALTSPVTSLSISLNQVSQSDSPCLHALGAAVDFEWRDEPTPSGSSCGFLCKVDRECLDLSQVCDGISDCSDSADETQCFSFVQVEWDYLYPSSTATAANYSVTSYFDCRTIAIANGTTAFGISSNETVCIVYSPTSASAFITNASKVVVSASGFNVYAITTTSTYSHCSAGLTCSSHGTLKTTLLPDNVTVQCQCVCYTGYSGSSCSTHIDMVTVGPIIVQYKRAVSTITEANPVYIETALSTLTTGSVGISCSSFYQINNLTTTYCSVTSGQQTVITELYTAVALPSTLQTMKKLLGTSDVASVTLSTATYLQSINCQSLYGDASCPLDGSTSVSYVMVRGLLSKALSSIYVNVTSIGTTGSRRSGATVTTSYSCLLGTNLITTWKKNGCVRSQCAVAIDGLLVTNISISVPEIDAQVASADSCFQQVDVQTVAAVTAPTVETHLIVANSAGDFSAFLIAGICVAFVGIVVLAAAIFATYRDRKNVSEAVDASVEGMPGSKGPPSSLRLLLVTTFSRMNLYNSTAARIKAAARLLLVIATYDIIAAVFLIILFKTSVSYDSNVQLVFERHRDSMCDASPFASMPIAIGRLSPTTGRSCGVLEVYGTASTAVYAAGYCKNSGGKNVVLYLQAGRSMYDCERAPLVQYPSGVCAPTTSVFNLDVPDSSYVRILCGAIGEVTARFEALTTNLTSATTTVGSTLPTALPSTLRQHWDDDSLVQGGVATYKRVQGSELHNTSSTSACRFDSVAKLAHVGSNNSLSLLVQYPVEALMENDAPFSLPQTHTLEQSFEKNNYAVPSGSAELGPSDGDYPTGFIYNDFNTSSSASGTSAAAGAAKYYGIRGSYADIGKYFNKKMLTSEGDGFTISLFLRATQATRGFAFAVADALEDESSSSPIVDAMQEIISNGSPDSSWFAFAHSLYGGLYVDGGEKVIRFVYGNAPFDATGKAQDGASLSSRVVSISWNLKELSMMRLLNGAWHDVQIILRTENSQTKAQLVVDGETSAYSSSWNRCVIRRPIPIAAVSTATMVPVTASLSQRFYPDGVLYTGYFNGGVAHLSFSPKVRSVFEIWRQSTAVVRSYNPFDGSKYIVLGSLLLAAGFAFLVSLVFTSGREIFENRLQAAANDELLGFHLYVRLWRAMPKDEHHIRFEPMMACHARRLLSVAPRQFVIFLEQLRDNFPHPEQELVRLLYVLLLSRTGDEPIDLTQRLPTAEQWDAMIAKYVIFIDQERTLLGDMVALYDDDDPADINAIIMEQGEMSGSGVTNRGAAGSRQEQGDRLMSLDQKRKREGAIVINTDNLVFGGTTQMASQGANATVVSGMTSDIKQLLMPFLTAIQSVYVWMTTVVIPQSYVDAFSNTFSFLFIDWSAALPTLPAVTTPLLHFFCGAALCGCLFYLIHHDELAFAWHLGRYTLRRDEIESEVDGEGAVGAHAFAKDLVAVLGNPFVAEAECERTFNVPLLGLEEARKIELFLGRMRATRPDQEVIANADELTVVDLRDRAFVLTRDPTVLEERDGDDGAQIMPVRVASVDATAGVLELVGARCIIHRHHRLSSQNQTDVWPFKNRPTCCMVINGERCDCSTGMMYLCGHPEVNDKNEKSSCSYAVCDKHYHGTLTETLYADVLALYRSVQQYGLTWFFATVFLFAANALYTPIIKTALMILGCHPYFQCTFACWAVADKQFLCAAFLSIVILLFYGLGYPVGLTFLLQRRSQMINSVFFADEYDGRYGRSDANVNLSEWNRFAATDPTALATLYNTFELRWLFVPPILLAWKVVLLLPPVYFESGSFSQSIGVAVVEFCYGVFIFWTEPAISPLVDAMYKIGAAHQMIFLGLQALNVYFTYKNDGTDLTDGMITTTACYLAFCILCVAYAKLAPAVKAAVYQMHVTSLLSDLGMQYSAAVGLFIVPSKDPLFDMAALPPGGVVSMVSRRRSTAVPRERGQDLPQHRDWPGTGAIRLQEDATILLTTMGSGTVGSGTAVVAFGQHQEEPSKALSM